MTKSQISADFSKSRTRVVFEYVLLALCVCVIALRTSITEGMSTQSASHSINLGDSVYTLSLSAVLIFSFVLWFVWSFCSRRFLYRLSGMEVGLCLFIPAAIIAGIFAADKRGAINNFAALLAPILMGILLVQILDSQSKVRLLLVCIAALGVVSAWQCSEQFFVSNRMMIERYEESPTDLLESLGIASGSLQHWQFEHRLYSKDVKGFFITGNSAGSFGLMASFAAVALFLERFRNRRFFAVNARRLFVCGIGAGFILFGLVITGSKGAIGASLAAAAMFVLYLLCGDWLKAHKKLVLISCLLLALSSGCVIVWYGLAHGQLPGGNSMLVRWQYWRSTVQMYADHPFFGVGPGNFADFYVRYKPAAAMEAVADPHNFLLSILTQYGPLGLAGFLALILVPLWRVIFYKEPDDTLRIHRHEQPFTSPAAAFAIVVSGCLLLIRPMITPVAGGEPFGVMVYTIFTLYIAPVAAFIVGFWFFTDPMRTTHNTQKEFAPAKAGAIRNTNITVAALFCAVVGVLIHNLIDFAIFEPGVFTIFWAIMAVLVAVGFNRKPRRQLVLKPTFFVKGMVVVSALAVVWAYFAYALIPEAKAIAKIKQSYQAGSDWQFQRAHNLLAAAADDDRLSAAALSLNGRLYLQRFGQTEPKQEDLLLESQLCLLEAIERNKADFKNYERLADVYVSLANVSEQEEKVSWLNEALYNINLAVERYPGLGRLHFKLAEIAEQLGTTELAIEHYGRAVDIEQSYRAQYRAMYPRSKLLSRLGEEKYQTARQKIRHLSKQPVP